MPRGIPSRYIKVGKSFRTVSIRKKTGKLMGRKTVKGFGDRTTIKRIVRKGSPLDGQIIGRTSPIKIRGDSKKRGTIRRTI